MRPAPTAPTVPERRATSSHRRASAPAALALAAAVLVCALAPADAARRPRKEEPRPSALEHVTATRPAFGATCEAEVEGRAKSHAEQTVAAVLDALASMSAALDRADPASELARVEAAAAGTRTPCSPALWHALGAALAVARETGGAYDPTAAVIADAWRRASPLRPESGVVAEARARTGWSQLALEPGTRTVRFPRAGMALDLGGVGRGAALDRAVDSLRARGMRRARLTIGDVSAVFADQGDAWALTVPDPRARERSLFGLSARQGAIATSDAGTRSYDPRTGMPVFSDASVTVVTRSAARAQALALGLRIMGRDAAAAFAARHRDVGVLWLELDGTTVAGWRWNMPALAEAPGALVRWLD